MYWIPHIISMLPIPPPSFKFPPQLHIPYTEGSAALSLIDACIPCMVLNTLALRTD